MCVHTPGPSGVPGSRMPVQPPGVRTDALTRSAHAHMHVYVPHGHVPHHSALNASAHARARSLCLPPCATAAPTLPFEWEASGLQSPSMHARGGRPLDDCVHGPTAVDCAQERIGENALSLWQSVCRNVHVHEYAHGHGHGNGHGNGHRCIWAWAHLTGSSLWLVCGLGGWGQDPLRPPPKSKIEAKSSPLP